MSSTPPDEVLPCGCLLRCTVVNGTNTLTVSPCHPSCRHLAALLELAGDAAVPVERRRG